MSARPTWVHRSSSLGLYQTSFGCFERDDRVDWVSSAWICVRDGFRLGWHPLLAPREARETPR